MCSPRRRHPSASSASSAVKPAPQAPRKLPKSPIPSLRFFSCKKCVLPEIHTNLSEIFPFLQILIIWSSIIYILTFLSLRCIFAGLFTN